MRWFLDFLGACASFHSHRRQWLGFWSTQCGGALVLLYALPGQGVMASKTATPLKACSLALANHLVFGLAMALAFSL